MSTTRKIAHNTIVQVAGKAISTILGLLAIGMMTRYLGQEQFGWYITVITFLGAFGILIDFGLIPVTAQMLSEPKHDKKQLLQNLLGFRFVSALLFLALAPAVALLFPYPNEVKLAIAFTAISFLAIAMGQVLIGYYQTRLKMHIQAASEVVGRLILVGGLWWVIARDGDFLSVMWIVVASSVGYTLLLWLFASRETPVGFRFDWPVWKAIMGKSWPIAISIVFNVVYLKGDTIMLSLFADQSVVGVYGAAYRIIEVLTQLAMMVMGVMMPLLAFHWSRKKLKDFRHQYQQAFDIMMMLSIPMVVGAIVLAKPIMILVAGPEFAGAALPLQILSIAVFGVYLGAIFGHTAVAINKQKQVMWIYISDAVLTLAGYLIFIPMYGMIGAAWMTVFSELYAGILLFFAIRHYSKQHLQVATLAKIIFAAAVMGSVIFLLPQYHVLILVALGGVVYAGLLFGLGAVSKKTIQEVISLR